MTITLSVNTETCIECGKCVKVCPAGIFKQFAPATTVEIQSIESCIGCGHCASACPSGSVIHSLFPPESVHAIDYSALPTPEQILLLCRARRSNRAFSKKPVPEHELDMILEAAHLAPTGSNAQNVSFTVVTDPEKIKMVADFTIETFYSIARKLQNPILKPLLKIVMPGVYKYLPAFVRLKAANDNGDDQILRGATTLIFIHTPKSSRLGVMDCNLAYQNGSLMAQTLSVSQFYLGFVCMAIKQQGKGELARRLGIDGEINAAMGLGMPIFNFPNYVDRSAIEVTRV